MDLSCVKLLGGEAIILTGSMAGIQACCRRIIQSQNEGVAHGAERHKREIPEPAIYAAVSELIAAASFSGARAWLDSLSDDLCARL